MEFDLPAVHEALSDRLGERPAILTSERRLSWDDLRDRTRRIANLLLDSGLTVRAERPDLAPHRCGQDTVALYLYNGHQYLESMVGAFKARLVPCNVNYRYTESELLELLVDMSPGAIVFHGCLAPRVAAAVERLDRSPLLLQVADASGEALLPGAVDYEEAIARSSPAAPPVRPTPDDLYILYTGGTTGRPKGVLWRQADIFPAALGGRNFRQGREWGSLAELVERAADRPGPRTLSAAPFMHGTGQWVALQALHSGGAVVVPRVVHHFDAADVLDTIEAEDVGLLVIAGEAFAAPLLDALDERRRDLGSLAVVSSSGAALSNRSVRRLLDRLPGLRVRNSVGSSEAGPMADTLTGGDADDTTSFVPSEGTSVVDASMSRVVAPGEPGIGWLARAGRIPLGYLHDPERTGRTFRVVGGVRMSVPGDRARSQADGTIVLVGRDAATINSGGEKIFAGEVEDVVRMHPDVRDVVVVGRPSERWGSEVVAVVQPRPGVELRLSDVRSFCEGHIARYKAPKGLILVSRVERGPSGKVDYAWAAQVARGSGDTT